MNHAQYARWRERYETRRLVADRRIIRRVNGIAGVACLVGRHPARQLASLCAAAGVRLVPTFDEFECMSDIPLAGIVTRAKLLASGIVDSIIGDVRTLLAQKVIRDLVGEDHGIPDHAFAADQIKRVMELPAWLDIGVRRLGESRLLAGNLRLMDAVFASLGKDTETELERARRRRDERRARRGHWL